MYFHVSSPVLLIMVEGVQLIPPGQLSSAVTFYQTLLGYAQWEPVWRNKYYTNCKILIDLFEASSKRSSCSCTCPPSMKIRQRRSYLMPEKKDQSPSFFWEKKWNSWKKKKNLQKSKKSSSKDQLGKPVRWYQLSIWPCCWCQTASVIKSSALIWFQDVRTRKDRLQLVLSMLSYVTLTE